jgi:hypothetical protein
MKMKRMTLLMLGLSTTLAAACTPPEEEEMDAVTMEGCEHAQNGPNTDITLTADATGAPNVDETHRAYVLATVEVDTDGNRGGTFTFESAMEGHYTFFQNHHFDIAVADSMDMAVDAHMIMHEVAMCSDDLAMFHVFELGVGTYTVDIGPTQMESVKVIIEMGLPGGEPGEHGEHGDDDMSGMDGGM